MVATRTSFGSYETGSSSGDVSSPEPPEFSQVQSVKGLRKFHSTDVKALMLQEYSAIKARTPREKGAVAALYVK